MPIPDDRFDVDKLKTESSKKRRDDGNGYPCVSCGAAIKGMAVYVHLCDGGNSLRTRPLDYCDTPGACLALYPVGIGCWRRLVKQFPELAVFEVDRCKAEN